MISSTSHLKYAQALFQIAVKHQMEERIWHELKALVDLYQHKSFKKVVLQLDVLEKSIKEELLDKTFEGKVHSLLLHLLKLLAIKKKIALLPKIYEAYSHFYHEAKGIDEVVIRTARPLSKEEEHALKQKLEQQKNKKITLHFEQKPELIAGAQIFEKGYLTDYSMKNYLESLQYYLLKATS